MDKNNEKKLKRTTRSNKRQKRIIVGLACALALAGSAAILAPTLVSVLKKNGGDTPQPGPTPTPTGKNYTVTFDSDGGSTINAQKVIEGEKAVKPEPPTKQGYAFVNWNDAETGTLFDFNTPILRNRSLKAVWAPKPTTTITITFDAWENESKPYGKFVNGEHLYPQDIEKGSKFKEIVSKPEVVPNDGWEHSGWVDSTGTPISGETTIDEPTTIHASYKIALKTVDITFAEKCLSSIGGTAKVTSGSKSMPVTKNITWDGISDNAKPTVSFSWNDSAEEEYKQYIPSFAGWSTKEQTKWNPTEEELKEAIISDEYVFSAKSTTLYPWFTFDQATQILTLEMVALEGQTIEGSTKIEVPYKPEEMDGGTIKTFGQLTKPQVTQGKKVFEGYYSQYDEGTQQFSNKWNNGDKITPELIQQKGSTIYVKMEEVDNNVSINFVNPTESEPHRYTWTGPTDLKCERGKKLSEVAPKVFMDADPNPSSEYGYSSDYYFVQWHDNETKKAVKDTTVINSAKTYYPEFKQKPTITFWLNTTGSTTSKTNADPNGLWRDVIQPQPEQVAGSWFIGWQGAKVKATGKTEYVDLNETTLLSTLDLTQPIKPKYEEYENCYKINVDTTAAVDNGTGELTEKTDMIYRGCEIESDKYQYGVPKSTDPIYLAQIAKPFVPCAPTKDGGEYNHDIKFNNRWQLKTDTNGWEEITEDTPLTTDVTIRPIVSGQFRVVFNNGDHGSIQGQSEYMTTSSIAFKDMDQPEVVADPYYKFVGWKDKNGNMVDNNTTFTHPDEEEYVELTAVYEDDSVYTKVNYHIFEDELKDTTFPATPINTANNFTSVKTATSETKTNYVYSEFDYISAERKYYSLLGWGYQYTGDDTQDVYEHGGKKYKLIKEDAVIEAGTSLDLYAIFKQKEGEYLKFTIASSAAGEPAYTIKGDNKFFAKTGEAFPFHETTGQILGFDITISAVGYEIDYWVDKDGNKLTGLVQPGVSYDGIHPHFKTSKRYVSFSNNGDTDIKFTENDEAIAREIPFNDKLLDYVGPEATKTFLDTNYPKAPKVKRGVQDFKHWAIKQGDELIEITDDTIVESNITLVPVFYEESVFQYGTNPYFYDEEKGDWAEITSNDPTNEYMEIKYTDGNSGRAFKDGFNYEIRLGKNMTKIPDFFMYGCTSWNNGGKSFEIPEKVIEIGSNVLYGCASFNQKITMETISYMIFESKLQYFKIGQNFMRECYSFNSDITLSTNALVEDDAQRISIGSGFMYDCLSFNKKVILKGWFQILDEFGEQNPSLKKFLNCMSISDKYLFEHSTNTVHLVASNYTDIKTQVEDIFRALNGEIVIESHTIPTPYRRISFTYE